MSTISPFFRWDIASNAIETKVIIKKEETYKPYQYNWSWVDDFINNLPRNSLIYDVGCGNGKNMTNKRYEFFGIDNSPKFLDICKEKSLNVIRADMYNLPFKEQSADAVICISSLHQLSTYEKRKQTLAEIQRVLKPGGKGLISVWSIRQPERIKNTFKTYGDNIVNYYDENEKPYKEYYYIFRLNELASMIINSNLWIFKRTWEFGNEVFEVRKV